MPPSFDTLLVAAIGGATSSAVWTAASTGKGCDLCQTTRQPDSTHKEVTGVGL